MQENNPSAFLSAARRSEELIEEAFDVVDLARLTGAPVAAEQRDELAASDESCHLIPPAGRATEG